MIEGLKAICMQRGDSFVGKNYLQVKTIFAATSGETVTRVALERGSAHILFKTAELVIEAGWKLFDQAHILQDQSEVIEQRKLFALWRIVGTKLSDVHISQTAFNALTVSFTNGIVLEIEANDDGFEDWSLAASNQSFWFVCNGRC